MNMYIHTANICICSQLSHANFENLFENLIEETYSYDSFRRAVVRIRQNR